MITTVQRLVVALGLIIAIPALTPAQAETTGQQRIVERARLALDAFLDDPNFDDMRVYVQNAYAVLIVPEMLKAGFFFGAEHGIGLLLVRDPQSGAWGHPAFYDVWSGSFGLQFGGQSSDVVLTIMNQGATDQLLNADVKLKFGAEVGLAAGRVGAHVGAATTTRFGEDMYIFAKSKGLFGGMAVDGGVVMPKDDWNRAFYGREIAPETIVRSRQVVAINGIDALHSSLTRF